MSSSSSQEVPRETEEAGSVRTSGAEAQPKTSAQPASKDILVVDDSIELLEWMKLDLEARGYRVHTALSGEECIRCVEQLRPPCVLLDVMMPGDPTLAWLLEQHETLRDESTMLLDESVYCLENRTHRPLYQILSAMPPELPLMRDETNRLLVYQKAEDVYKIVTHPDFTGTHGEVFVHLDGYTTCQLITSCSQFKNVHIILFTAGGSGTKNERVQRAFQAGASDYLLKSEYYTLLFDRLETYTNAQA